MKKVNYFLLLACIIAPLHGADKPVSDRSLTLFKEGGFRKMLVPQITARPFFVDEEDPDQDGIMAIIDKDGKHCANRYPMRYIRNHPEFVNIDYTSEGLAEVVIGRQGAREIVSILFPGVSDEDLEVIFQNEWTVLTQLGKKGVTMKQGNDLTSMRWSIRFFQNQGPEAGLDVSAQPFTRKNRVATKKAHKELTSLGLTPQGQRKFFNYQAMIIGMKRGGKLEAAESAYSNDDYQIVDIEMPYFDKSGRSRYGKVPFYTVPGSKVVIAQENVANGTMFLQKPLANSSITEIEEGQG